MKTNVEVLKENACIQLDVNMQQWLDGMLTDQELHYKFLSVGQWFTNTVAEATNAKASS
jgi:hypothetical protein